MCKVRILFSSLLDMMCGSLKENKPEHLKKHFYPEGSTGLWPHGF